MAALLRRFYGCAERVLFPEAIIDKVVGDQVMALYLPDVQRRITRARRQNWSSAVQDCQPVDHLVAAIQFAGPR